MWDVDVIFSASEFNARNTPKIKITSKLDSYKLNFECVF